MFPPIQLELLCVVDKADWLAGIFTGKVIVLDVIAAAELDAERQSALVQLCLLWLGSWAVPSTK